MAGLIFLWQGVPASGGGTGGRARGPGARTKRRRIRRWEDPRRRIAEQYQPKPPEPADDEDLILLLLLS